jgi:hypothetical protein
LPDISALLRLWSIQRSRSFASDFVQLFPTGKLRTHCSHQ